MTPTETIWCPAWCKFTTEEHQTQVAAGDTELVHQSTSVTQPMDAVLTTLRLADGTPVLEDPSHEPVMFLDGDEYVSPDDFVEHAEETLRFVEMARRTGPHQWLTCPSWCTEQHTSDDFPYDDRDGRPGHAHVGYAAGGRFFTTVVYDAETGAEWYRFVAYEASDDFNTFEEFDRDGISAFASCADLAAKWARREVEIP